MTFSQALAIIMWSMIVREIPVWKANPDSPNAVAYRKDIALMIEVDRKVTQRGVLVSPEIDRLLIGGMRFFEGRFQSRPKDGDCIRGWHSYYHVPRGRWPQGYVPKPYTKCPAKGPMQISEGNLGILPAWEETRELFADLQPWKQRVAEGVNPWHLKKLTVDELREPETNVRLGYAALWHFKNTCKGRPADDRSTPPGGWMTAWGWGKCPPPNRRAVIYVDKEGRQRCEKTTQMMRGLEALSRKDESQFTFQVPEDWWCGNESGEKPHPETEGSVLAIGSE
jgi:hypothetical protein